MNNVVTRAIVAWTGMALFLYGTMLRLSNQAVDCPGHDQSVFGLILIGIFWVMIDRNKSA